MEIRARRWVSEFAEIPARSTCIVSGLVLGIETISASPRPVGRVVCRWTQANISIFGNYRAIFKESSPDLAGLSLRRHCPTLENFKEQTDFSTNPKPLANPGDLKALRTSNPKILRRSPTILNKVVCDFGAALSFKISIEH